MNAIITSLAELIRMFTDSFRLSAVFPALLFVLLNRLIVFPRFDHLAIFREIVDQGLWDHPLVFSLIVLLLGYTINAIEVPIIRLYEGYAWRDTGLGRHLVGKKQARFKWLNSKIRKQSEVLRWYQHFRLSYPDQITQLDAEIKRYQSELIDGFPLTAEEILPTKLGNTVAAFEAYPWKHYGMDGVTFWSRIFPILAKEGFLPYVTQARSTVDFLLNTSLLMFVFGAECVLLRILFISSISWVWPVTAFVGAWFYYLAATSNVPIWGAMFKTGFDLFRYHLADAVGLKVAESLQQEKTRWTNLNEFWQRVEEFKGFAHSESNWPVQQKKGDEK